MHAYHSTFVAPSNQVVPVNVINNMDHTHRVEFTPTEIGKSYEGLPKMGENHINGLVTAVWGRY